MSPELLGQARARLPSHSPPPALPSCKRSNKAVSPPNPLDARLHHRPSASRPARLCLARLLARSRGSGRHGSRNPCFKHGSPTGGGEGGVFALGSGVAKIDGYAPERVDLARQDGQCWLLVGQRCGRQDARLTDGRQHCEGEVRFGEGASEPSTSSPSREHGSGGRHAGIRQPGDDLPAMPPPAQSP